MKKLLSIMTCAILAVMLIFSTAFAATKAVTNKKQPRFLSAEYTKSLNDRMAKIEKHQTSVDDKLSKLDSITSELNNFQKLFREGNTKRLKNKLEILGIRTDNTQKRIDISGKRKSLSESGTKLSKDTAAKIKECYASIKKDSSSLKAISGDVKELMGTFKEIRKAKDEAKLTETFNKIHDIQDRQTTLLKSVNDKLSEIRELIGE